MTNGIFTYMSICELISVYFLPIQNWRLMTSFNLNCFCFFFVVILSLNWYLNLFLMYYITVYSIRGKSHTQFHWWESPFYFRSQSGCCGKMFWRLSEMLFSEYVYKVHLWDSWKLFYLARRSFKIFWAFSRNF